MAPLYRLQPQFARLGIALGRGTMALWMIRLGGTFIVPLRLLEGYLLRVTPGGQYQVVSDVAGHESKFNPAGGTLDSNPYGVLAQPGRRIVADAGANAVIEVLANGRTRTLALLPALPGGRQTVPTAVAEGPDGALYVGQLTGFPFFAATASVHRVESDGSSSSVHVAGLTAIVDVAFDAGGALYVLEVASGQQAPFPPPNPGLGAAYVTNFGTSVAGGQVLRLAVTPCP